MKKPRFPFLPNKLGVSYTISAVIMTAVTITLVIVASSYAYQLLERQRGAAEFEVAKESILAFDDALENVAWKPNAAQSARFTISYGQLKLIPRVLTLRVNATVGNNTASYSTSTGFIRYSIENKYVNFWERYSSYILGDKSLIVTNSTQSFGRAFIEQRSGWVNITLDYRIRAMRTSEITVNGTKVNYVDIWIIKLEIPSWSTYIHDFNLKARCANVTTQSHSFDVSSGENCTISVQLGSEPGDSTIISLGTPGKVVFNFIVAEVKVSA